MRNGLIDEAMPARELSSPAVFALASTPLSLRSFRPRDQGSEMDPGAASEQLDGFQKCVADLFFDLSAAAGPKADGLLSIAWLRKLLDAFLLCHAEFRALLIDSRDLVASPPLDRLVTDFYDRALKALDICNAVRDGIDQLRRWRARLEIVVAALSPSSAGDSSSRNAISEGQLRRARKALADVSVLMLDGSGSSAISHRNRSFGRSAGSSSSPRTSRHLSNFRSLSWSVSRSWSAARQLQAIGSNVTAPRSQDVVATAGMAVPVYTMNAVLLFTMWSMVAAIPCQDRDLQANFSIPRTFAWAAPVVSLHERFVEESKKRERRNSAGLLKEIQQIERCTHQLTELIGSIKAPMSEVEEMEVRQRAEELGQVCDDMKKELEPLERQVREIFLRIVRDRTDGIGCSSSSQAAD